MSVELTPQQAQHLLNAYWHERRRRLFAKPPANESQVLAQADRRDREMEDAIALGVYREQAQRFVFWEEK